MKSILLMALLATFTVAEGCKTKKATAAAPAATSSSTSTPGVSGGNVAITTSGTTSTTASGTTQGAYVGKISHKYRSGGCSSVIVFTGEDGNETVIIPMEKLNADIDLDGQTIKFDYHPLKMPQPAGCTTGIPASVTNITRLK